MLLIIAIILAIIFLAGGFAAHLLWLGLIIALIVGIVHFVSRT